jgi:hypothetical protein
VGEANHGANAPLLILRFDVTPNKKGGASATPPPSR